MISENDFEKVFAKIEELVNDKPVAPYEEGIEITMKSSTQADTKDTGAGTSFDVSDFDKILARH